MLALRDLHSFEHLLIDAVDAGDDLGHAAELDEIRKEECDHINVVEHPPELIPEKCV
jgi:hypothetical protein